MKKVILLVVVVITSLYSQKKIAFEFDYASFRYNASERYLEVYYSVQQSSLNIQKGDSSYSVDAVINLSIVDSSTGKVFSEKKWKVKNSSTDSTELTTNLNLIGIVGLAIPPGKYLLTISATDETQEKQKAVLKDKLNLAQLVPDSLSLSDIQIASRIIPDSPHKESIFYKNTMEVIPAPTLLFGESLPVVYYYVELYNLLNYKTNFDIHTFLYNSNGAVVYSKKKKIVNRSESRVEVNTVNISKMPTGAYTLVLIVTDSTASKKTYSSKKFFVYNPTVADTSMPVAGNTDFMGSQFAILSNEECDMLFSKSKYIATRDQVEKFKKLSSIEGKREFLFKFWKDKDEVPETPENETFMKYFARVDYANQKFTAMKKEGWKTDRGRVYLIYGEPSEIERYPNQLDSKPYEIWQYHNLEGGVIFVFADLTGFSDYQLINSTMRGELRDDTWQRRIITN